MFQIKNIFLESYFLFHTHVKEILFYCFFPSLFYAQTAQPWAINAYTNIV